MLYQALYIAFLVVFIGAEEVYKKQCANVDSFQCVIHTVNVEPCLHGPRFCSIFLGKSYSINVNFTPYFSAQDLKVSVTADLEDGAPFAGNIYKDACRRLLTCPLEAHIRQSFVVPLTFDKSLGKIYQGKFPVQVKLWNAENESQACCFSFKAKMK